jgi:hypothetical protein
MERLWAGDYSQLPAGQQLHALNLSAQQQQQAWLGQHQGNKVRSGERGLLALMTQTFTFFFSSGARNGRDEQR